MATVPYEILNSLSPLMTLIKKIAIGAYNTICKTELTTTMMALCFKGQPDASEEWKANWQVLTSNYDLLQPAGSRSLPAE